VSCAVGLTLAAPLDAQTIGTALAATPTLAGASSCASCPPELAPDPLVAISQQFTDALTAWDQAAPMAVFCLVGGTTAQPQFVIVASAAAAPADATCVTRGGAPVPPEPAPSSPGVTPPANTVPPAVGPVMPAPVQDIVIERPTPTPPAGSQPTPAPALVQRPAPVAPTSTPVPPPSSPPRRRPTPTPAPLDADRARTPSAAPSTAAGAPAFPAVAYPPALRADTGPAPVMPESGSADTSESFVPLPLTPQAAPGVRALSGLTLGLPAADYFGNLLVTDPSVLMAGTLFLGGSFVPLQASDGTAVWAADAPFSFTLSPEAAAPLAGSGRPGPFRVFAFNADTGAFDELPTTLVLYDDGSVMVTVLPPAPPVPPATINPAADVSAVDAPPDAEAADASATDAEAAPADAASSDLEVAPADEAPDTGELTTE
jgi:hypothetical protein